MRKELILIFFFLTTLLSQAQYVDSGQDPASIKWKQINTDNFQIIFPTGFEIQANYLANIFDSVYYLASQTLENQPAKISVLLHTYTSVANANVLWAPKRSNFYTIPPQDIYVQDWLEQLAIHEFRHVVQIDKMNQGVTQILYYLFGQQGTAAVFGMYIPFWLVEGDAVVAETNISQSGRGRLPSFSMPLRAQILEKKIYSYDKAYLGSYKSLVPDYYTLGYFLSAHARYQFGSKVWANTFDYVARNPFNPWSFNTAMKRFAGQGKRRFYKNTLLSLDSAWQEQEVYTNPKVYERVNISKQFKGVFNSYLYPQSMSEDRIVVLKKSFEEVEKLIIIDSYGNEKMLKTPGLWVSNNRISATPEGNKIVWNAYQWDVRWTNRVYSAIHIFDQNLGKSRKLTHKSYLFSPAIAPDGKKVVAVESMPNYENSLVVFDADHGNELQRFQLSGNPFLIAPQWDSAGEKIVFIQLKDNQKIATILNTKTGNISEVFTSKNEDISNPAFFKHYILFTGVWSGIDNIYAVDTVSGKLFQITNSKFGAFNISVDSKSNHLLFNEYTSDGIVVSKALIDTSEWILFDKVNNYGFKLYEDIALEDNHLIPDRTQFKDYEIKPYRKYKNLFNIHSWGPLALNIENYSVQPAISLLSQNVLSTSFTSLKYAYDLNEQSGGVFTDFTYKGLYPEISIGAGFQNRNRLSSNKQEINWRENSLYLRTAVPLKHNSGPYLYYATPSLSYSYISINQLVKSVDINEGEVHSLHFRMSASRNRKRAYLDLKPRWGQSILAGVRSSPLGSFEYNTQAYAQMGLYFPGLFKNHSLFTSIGIQKQIGTDKLRYTDAITPIRGLRQVYDNRLTVVKINYTLPLFYPDLSIPGLLYVKRLYMNAFYDVGIGENSGIKDKLYKSTGAEVMANFHVLSHIIPIAGGVRYSYLPEYRTGNIQLIINLEI
jgi:hypothetical protein